MSGNLHAFPAWQGNPYLNMLYIGLTAEGWHIEGTKNVDSLERAVRRLGKGDVLHVHWTSPILQRTDRAAARTALDQFQRLVHAFKQSGGALIWTVHNAFTHDARFPDLEVELAEALASHADRIIQLNGMTREVVSEHYDLPADKLVTLRHASYAGIYAAPPSALDARARRGIPAFSSVVGFIGQMRPYKGLPTLFRAMELVADDVPDVTLVLAGKTAPTDRAALEKQLPRTVPIVREHSFISDDEIGSWFAACDVVVFPYERVLNSGSILMASTFGRPCIIPNEPHLLAEWGGQAWVRFYDKSEMKEASLAETIVSSLADGPAVRAKALEFAASYRTLDMAWDYVRIVEDVVDRAKAGRHGR